MSDLKQSSVALLEKAIDDKIARAQSRQGSTLATVTRVDNDGTTWVHVYGGADETPVRRMTSAAAVGDVINVTFSGLSCMGVGNVSSPSATTKQVQRLSNESAQAIRGVMDGLLQVNTVVAQKVSTKNLDAEMATILTAAIDNATINALNAKYATISSVEAGYAKIDAANINTAAIRDAWVDNLLVQTGLLANDGTVFTLDAVEVDAANITTGTLDVRRLIITRTVDGEDQKYLVDIDPETSQPSYVKLDGDVLGPHTVSADKLVAHSITASEITTQNLVGTGGWINLADGTFLYYNQSTGSGIAWDGEQLIIGGSARIGGSSGRMLADMASASDSVEYIVGTQTATTNVWTGVTRDAAIYTGKKIAYYLPQAGNSSAATLNLTLSGGGTTGAKNVRWNNTNVTTHYPQYSVIQLVYDGTYWRTSAYNSDTMNRKRIENAVKIANANITKYCIAGHVTESMAANSGYKMVASGVAIDLQYPIAYLNQNTASGQSYAVAANATTTNFYTAINSVSLTNTKSGWTGTQYAMCFLKGTVNGNKFTVHSDVFTTTVPTTDDGYVYIPIGMTYSTTQVNFDCDNSLYAYVDGKFRQVTTTEVVKSQVVYYRSASNTAPSAPKTTWITTSTLAGTSADYETWILSVPPVAVLSSGDDGILKYPYLFTCTQYKRLDGTIECSDVAKDSDTLIVDGDAIINGSVSADKLIAHSISSDYIIADDLHVSAANIDGTLTVEQIDTSGISLTRTQISGLDDELASLSNGIDEQSSALADAVGGINAAIEETNSNLDGLASTVSDVASEIDERITAITDGIDVQADHISLFTETTSEGVTSKTEARLTSDKLAFIQNETEVAYIGDESLNITNAVVQDTLVLGNFAFVPLATGGIALKWMGA